MSRLAALVVMACSAPCFADDGVGGSIAVTNDYVLRGISQSNGQAAIQGDVHYASPRGIFAGLWGSTVELNGWDGRTAELNAYLGYRWAFNIDWNAKLTAVHYAYPWNSKTVDYNYDDLIASLAFRDNLFFTAAYSFDSSRFYTVGLTQNQHALSYEVATAIPIVGTLAANAGLGHYYLPDSYGIGYTYWNAGVAYDWRAWHADLNYIGTSNNAGYLFFGDVAGRRVSATLLWRF